MKLAITGASGLTASYLLDRLEKEKFDGEITCIIRRGMDQMKIGERNLQISYAIGDISDIDFVSKAIRSSDVILNIAGASVSEGVLKAAKNNRIRWMISVHTTGIYSKYKSAAEEYLRIERSIQANKGNIDFTLIRPTMIYGVHGGNKDHNIHKLIKHLNNHILFPMFGEGTNLMQPVYAKDLGNAYYDILMKPEATKNKEYNLSGKAPLTYLDLIKKTSQALGKRNIIIKIPILISINSAKLYNFMFGNRAMISVEQVLRMQEDKVFPHIEAFLDFGYEPMGFEEGIKEEINEIRNHLKK